MNGVVKRICLGDGDGCNFLDNELGDAISFLYCKTVARMVEEKDLDATTVICINDTSTHVDHEF